VKNGKSNKFFKGKCTISVTYILQQLPCKTGICSLLSKLSKGILFFFF